MVTSRTRRFLLLLAGATGAGLLVRLTICHDLGRLPPLLDPPAGTDMRTYFLYAKGILEGEFPSHFYYQPFYYAVFLPLVFRLAFGHLWAVGLAQAVIGAACVWLVGLSGARLFGRRAGILAATLLAFARFHAFYTPFMLMAVVQSFWLILLLWLSLRAYQRNRWPDWLAISPVLAAAILTRGNALLFLPLILALLAWRNRRAPQFTVALAVLILIIVYLPQMPFALRNWRHYGRWTGPSSAQDAVLALGNSPEAPPGGLSYPPTYTAWMEDAQRPAGERIPVSRQIAGWAREAPWAFLELKFRTFLLFWDRREIPNNISIHAYAPYSSLLGRPVLLGFGILAPLAIGGMLTSRYRGKPQRVFALSLVAIYCLSTVMFYMLARFRLPAVPLLCVFAGGGAEAALKGGERLWRRRHRQAMRRSLEPLFAIALGGLLVWQAYPFYELRLGPGVLRLARPNGTLVVGKEAVSIMDHGSAAPFGWFHHSLSSVPTTVVKRVVVPAKMQRRVRRGKGTVEFAFFGQPGSQVEFHFPQADGTVDRVPFTFPSANEPHWLPMPWSLAPGDDELFAGFAVRVVAGRASLAVDRSRRYDRTLIGDRGGALQIARGEAVARVTLPLE